MELTKLDHEIKKYDIEDMKSDVIVKTASIAQGIKQIQSNMQFDEKTNIRHLSKIGLMQMYIEEDSHDVQESMQHTLKLQERANANFDTAKKES